MKKITLKYNEVFPVLEIANEYLKTYKTVSNNEFNYMLKFLAEGDGKLYIIINNFDISVKFTVNIQSDIKFSKVYQIEEIYNVFKGMKIYSEVEYYPEIDKIDYIEDAVFFLKPTEEPVEVFQIKEKDIKESRTSELNDFLKKELMSIKNILSLKNTKHSNIYFYTEDDMIFNFYNIYVKKLKTLRFIKSDIIGLQFLIYVFSKYDCSEFEYGINENKFVFKSKEFYIEGHNINLNNEELLFINSYFEKFKKLNTINVKLEFLNFVNTVFSLTPRSFLVFDDSTVRIETGNTEVEDCNAEFKIEGFTGYFIIKIVTLMKMLNYVLKHTKNLDEFEIVLGESGKCKWLQVNVDDTTIISEIGGDINEMTDDDSEEDEIFGEPEAE